MEVSMTATTLEKKSFAHPDDKRSVEKAQMEVVTVGDTTIGRVTFQPGWRWSTCVKPVSQTDLCEVPHLVCHICGRMHVKMQDGNEFDIGPGEVASIPPGHDAWVVGNEPVIAFDMAGASDYAKRR
jgi:hypothetical protein